MEDKSMEIKAQLKKLGYKIRYAPAKVIGAHIACYYVEYKGKRIRPRAAMKLKIPLNEIWISNKYKAKAEKILDHELCEIEYRWKGYSGKLAHKKAQKDDSRGRLLK